MSAKNTSQTYIFQSSGGPVVGGDTSTASTTLGTPEVSTVAVADTNGDGFLDVITAVGSTAYVFESVGSSPIPNGGTEAANTVLTGTSGASLSVAP